MHLPTITAVTILIFLSRYYQFYSITCRLHKHLVAYADGLSSTLSPVFRFFHQLPGSPQRRPSNEATLHAGAWFHLTQQSYTKGVIMEGERRANKGIQQRNDLPTAMPQQRSKQSQEAPHCMTALMVGSREENMVYGTPSTFLLNFSIPQQLPTASHHTKWGGSLRRGALIKVCNDNHQQDKVGQHQFPKSRLVPSGRVPVCLDFGHPEISTLITMVASLLQFQPETPSMQPSLVNPGLARPGWATTFRSSTGRALQIPPRTINQPH